MQEPDLRSVADGKEGAEVGISSMNGVGGGGGHAGTEVKTSRMPEEEPFRVSEATVDTCRTRVAFATIESLAWRKTRSQRRLLGLMA